MKYTPEELMICVAAREIKDTDVVFVGMRLPLLSFLLANATHAPGSVGIFENGLIRDEPGKDFIVTMCDPPNITGAVVCTTLREAMSYLQQGKVSLGFIGGAEVDVYGNLNTTKVGNVRLPGSGGGSDIASLAGRLMIIMSHQRRRFVPKVGYITSPGYGNGPGWRKANGLKGGGPEAVVTTYGVFRFNEKTKKAVLTQIHPGVDMNTIKIETGWDLEVSSDLIITPAPNPEEIKLIRKFDPKGFWTGRA
jgi:glutaconate CoA-transferase subunit B